MQALEERLMQFGQAAAGALDDLMAVLADAPNAGTDAATAKRALQRYVELVRYIEVAAGAAGLAGLQSICALTETNLLLLQDDERPLTAAEIVLLEEWPTLVFGYYVGQGNGDACWALLRNVAGAWPLPLPEDAAAEELQRLMGEPLQPTEHEPPSGAAQTGAPGVPQADLQQVDGEMLAILAHEFGQIREQLDADLAVLAQAQAGEVQTALANYCELLERMAGAVASVGMTALGTLFARAAHMVAGGGRISGPRHALLRRLPDRVAAYLAAPTDDRIAVELLLLFTDPAWPAPISEDEAAQWIGALVHLELTAGSARAAPPRQTEASAADVSLELPEDVNPELLEGLLQELPLQTSAFTTAIGRIASGTGSMKDLERAMRAAHTLKGAANTVGVRGIANLTHHTEDILVALLDAGRLPGRSLADVLLNTADCLEAMSEALLGLGPVPAGARHALQQVLDSANRIDHEGAAAEPEAGPAPAPLLSEAPVEAPEPTAPVIEQAVRVPASVTDELLRLAGETLTSNSQIQERLRLTATQSAVIRRQNQLIRQLVAELEELVDIRGITSPQQARTAAEFDALEFEHYSELHTVTHRLVEAATDAQEMADEADRQIDVLAEVLEQQHKLQMANQQMVMRTRMVAVSSIVPRMQRGVRQTARLLDKEVELVITGEHTNIDSHALNDLMDPLMHVLRNAVDHGIEAPEARVAAGKPRQGRIGLSFVREGNSIVVRCTDDGAGLDFGAIRRIAERKGMLLPGKEYTEDSLARLILAPGFSTREDASQVSGRGVGMDIVYSRVQELKGMLALHSRQGQGLTVELRLPATLLSTHTLIVRQREKRLALSTRGVEDIRYVTREQIQQIGPREFFRDEDSMFGLFKLESLLAMPGDRRAKERHGFPVLLTRMENGAVCAVLVQEILDSREVVLKNFGRYVPRTQGVIGAVILGDGGVAPVIDLVELLRTPPQQLAEDHAPELPLAPELTPVSRSKIALVVDDSLSARRAVVQVLKDAGFEVRTANDGLDAETMLARFVPDIMLVDMEMPRMNGLELTARVRSSERTKGVPVIMITSRSTEKHRQTAAASGVNVLLTKPFSEDELLEQVMRLVMR